jgi:hypothetical protein
MSVFSQFSGSGIRPSGLLNGSSSAGITTGQAVINAAVTGIPASQAAITTSGTLTANTLTTVLSVSGRGVLYFFGLGGFDSASRTHRAKITLDGVVIYDATSAAVTSTAAWVVPVGSVAPSATLSAAIIPDPLQFNTSLLIEYASSLSETAKTIFATKYVARS